MATEIEAAVFLIDKPAGPTSFRIVHLIRKTLQIKKVGHTGTLDPFASGLLIVCVGRPATRIISQLMDGEKVYEAVAQLGVETDTQDTEGAVIRRRPVGILSRAEVENTLARFHGEQEQIPPSFSALKHNGKPLYQYAREGIIIEKPARRIFIRDLSCLALEGEQLTFRVICSKGTYVRTLAADIGDQLGCGAHLIGLRRLKNGPFSVEEALPGELLEDRESAALALLDRAFTVEQVLGRVAGESPQAVSACPLAAGIR